MSDLLDIADRVVGLAQRRRAGRGRRRARRRDTEVRVYEGEVESLAVAESQGVGVRVVRDDRQGFAYGGTFDDDGAGRGPRRGPRQRRLRQPDELPAWPSPTASSRRRSTCGATTWPACPTDDKVDLALELERAVRAADPRIVGVESAEYADSLAEAAIVTTTGIRRATRSTGC